MRTLLQEQTRSHKPTASNLLGPARAAPDLGRREGSFLQSPRPTGNHHLPTVQRGVAHPVAGPLGHDFARVRVHAPRDIDAHAYSKVDVDRDTTNDEPKDEPKDAPRDQPKDAPAASGSCGGKSLAASVKGSDKRLGGTAVVASLDPDDFGNTSKLGADFRFSACKVGTAWRFQLSALAIPVASKVQPVTFRKNIDSAASAEVTKDSYSDIVRDLSPTRKVTFSVSCGSRKDKDKVSTYSVRKTYWNHQFVVDHEAFHRKDWVDMYRKELVKAESDVWAHSIPAADAKDAASAVAKANPDLTKYMTDAYQRLCDAYNPGKESRAYDNGAPAYQKLVDEINARAKKENW